MATYANLEECLVAMKRLYEMKGKTAVQSQELIYCLHTYCLDEMRRRTKPEQVKVLGLDDITRPMFGKEGYPKDSLDTRKYVLMPEVRVFGSHKNKDMDLVLTKFGNGPMMTIGIRSEMSSVNNNVANYYEGIIGECISLHERYPMAVSGYIYMLPTVPYKSGSTSTFDSPADLDKYEGWFERITNRSDWRGPSGLYEHFAFLRVDFRHEVPKVIKNSNSDLDFDTFFDRMLATYNERNYFNQLILN